MIKSLGKDSTREEVESYLTAMDIIFTGSDTPSRSLSKKAKSFVPSSSSGKSIHSLSGNPFLLAHLLKEPGKDGNLFDFKLKKDAKNGLPVMKFEEPRRYKKFYVSAPTVPTSAPTPPDEFPDILKSVTRDEMKHIPCKYDPTCRRKTCRFLHTKKKDDVDLDARALRIRRGGRGRGRGRGRKEKGGGEPLENP
jgi:hypothetical protein